MSTNTYASYQADSAPAEKSFDEIAHTIGSDVQKISKNVNSLNQLMEAIGTPRDSQELRQQLQKIQQYTQQLVKDTSNNLNTMSRIHVPVEQRQQRAMKERLTEEYTAVLNLFQATQKKVLQKESVQVKKKRAEINSANEFSPPYPKRDPFREDLQSNNQLIEFNDGGRSGTVQIQMEDESGNLEQLRQQEEALRMLEQDISDVNEIYKNLGRLVHDQGEMIDSIEAHIENTSANVYTAAASLKTAGDYAKSVRKKRCCLLTILGIVVFILLIYIWNSLFRK